MVQSRSRSRKGSLDRRQARTTQMPIDVLMTVTPKNTRPQGVRGLCRLWVHTEHSGIATLLCTSAQEVLPEFAV